MNLWEFENPLASTTQIADATPPLAPPAPPVVIDGPRVPRSDQGESSYAAVVRGEEAQDAVTTRGELPPMVVIDELPIPGFRGEYPTIRIPKRAYERGLDYCKQSLIGRVDVKDLDVEKFRQQAVVKWQSLGSIWMTPLGKGFIHIKFQSVEDYDKIWSGGPWKIGAVVLRISKWQKNFKPDSQKLTNAPVWVKLPKLPLEFWDLESLMAIGRALGYPIKVDESTLKKNYGFYALVQVDIDLTKPIPNQILIEHDDGEFWQDIVITKLPKFCNHCQMVGHWASDCTHVAALSNVRPQSNAQAVNLRTQARGDQRGGANAGQASGQQQRVVVGGNSGDSSRQGVWQVVQPRNNNRNRQRQGRTLERGNNRFSILQREAGNGEGLNDVVAPSSEMGVGEAPPAAAPVLTAVVEEGVAPVVEEGTQVVMTSDESPESPNNVTEKGVAEKEDQLELPDVAEVSRNENVHVTQEETVPVAEITTNENAQEVPIPSAAGVAIGTTTAPEEHETLALATAGDSSTVHEQDDPGDPGGSNAVSEEALIESEEISEAHANVIKEAEEVNKLLNSDKPISWADLLDEDEDDRESRPSLSQPRRSGRSRSRSKMLEPYVEK